MKKTTFKAGRYYVGDPCYVLDDKQWDEVLTQTGCFGYEAFSSPDENTFYIKGHRGWGNGTMWGDGTYIANNNLEYWVDSGTLGIIPIEALEDGNPDFRGGYDFETFKKDFEVYFEDGVFHFGDIVIDTN